MKTQIPIKAADYLRKPYARMVFPETDGTYRAEILEFPGCIAIGGTSSEALSNLEEVAESWLESAMALGQNIPEPLESCEFSGRLVLRLPKSLHKKAARAAERDSISLNQFIVSSVAQNVGEHLVATSSAHKMNLFEAHKMIEELSKVFLPSGAGSLSVMPGLGWGKTASDQSDWQGNLGNFTENKPIAFRRKTAS